ncbi:MAG: O-antigen ligase family protein [Planctomycetota bacterium]
MDILVSVLGALLCYALSGARSAAYLFYFLSFVPFLSLSATEGGLTAASGLAGDNVQFKLAVRALCTAGFLLLLLRRRAAWAALWRSASMPVIVLVLWAAMWIGRSQAPWVSLFRLTELASFFLVGVVLFAESARFHPLHRVLRWHCMALLSLPLLALWFAVTRPDLSMHADGGEITRWGHKLLNANSLGFACTIVILWGTSELKGAWARREADWRTRVAPALAIATCVGVLLMARSRTALSTQLIGQTILWWPRGSFSWAHVRIGIAGLVVLAVAMWQQDLIGEYMLRGEPMESLTSATGRTDLWHGLLVDQVPKAPLAGAGYLMLSEEGGFWHAGRVWTNAHNTYLFSLVSAGLVGLCCVLLIVSRAWLRSARAARLAQGDDVHGTSLLLALQTVLLVTSITGFGVFGFPNPAMLFFYSLYTLVLHPGGPVPIAPTAAIASAPLRPALPRRPQPATIL